MGGLTEKASQLELYEVLVTECGAEGAAEVVAEMERRIDSAIAELQHLPQSGALRANEPDDYQAILAARPDAARMARRLGEDVYRHKLLGALLCRFIGCTLGAPVEMWSVERMEAWAAQHGDDFPLTDYWSAVWAPEDRRVYQADPLSAFTRAGMRCVPADDDVVYTLMGLLIAENYGLDFSVDDVADAWKRWLPVACTAEAVALRNVKSGIPASEAADIDNPFSQWIGAAIRSDPWGYLAAGDPERAAKMAHQDALLSHRRNGIYGEMYLAAAQAAAFVSASEREALEAGLLEIPRDCRLAADIRWALAAAPSDWREARSWVDERFRGMSHVHTNNNLCLIVFALLLGGGNVTKTLGEVVAMGMDNDCTGASAGSIVGAVRGPDAIPAHWTRDFNDRISSFLIDHPSFAISDIVDRFTKLYI